MTRTAPFARRIACVLALMLALTALPSILAGCASGADGSNASSATGSPSSSGSASGSTDSTTVAEGNAVPDFEFETVDGKTAKLSDYKGQVVLLNFWATWCGYCMREMPDMAKIDENYPDVVVLAINRGDQPAKAIAKAKELNYGFVWGLDEDGAIEALYPANGIPYSVIIDKEGIITTIFSGSAEDMYTYFEEAVVKAGA